VDRNTVEVHLAGCPKDISAEDAAAIIAVVGCLEGIVEVTDRAVIEAAWVTKDSTGAPLLIQSEPYGRFFAKVEELRKWRDSQSDASAKSPIY
jgi:hypothetical protein